MVAVCRGDRLNNIENINMFKGYVYAIDIWVKRVEEIEILRHVARCCIRHSEVLFGMRVIIEVVAEMFSEQTSIHLIQFSGHRAACQAMQLLALRSPGFQGAAQNVVQSDEIQQLALLDIHRSQQE